MEISLNRRSVNCFRKISDFSVSCDTSAECVVPDVQEDIRQLLTTDFILKIRSKDIDLEEICIKAELLATVMYYSENGIEKLEMTLPVNARIPSKDTDSSCIVNADIKVSSWDLRLINPRKVSLKAFVSVKASCYRQNEFAWFEAPDELPEKLFVKSEHAVMRVTDCIEEKTFTAEDELVLPEGNDVKLISAFAVYHTESGEAVGNKLVLRGSANIEAIYLVDGKLVKSIHSIPFSQLFEISGESGDFEAVILSTGEYYDVSDGRLTAELHAVIQFVYNRELEFDYASDAYSCRNETELVYDESEYCASVNRISMQENLQLAYDSQREISDLLLTKAYVSKVEAVTDGINVTVNADLVCKDADDELFYGKIRGSLDFPIENSSGHKALCAEVSDIRAAISGNSIDFRATVSLTGRIEEYAILRSISAIEEGNALEGDVPSSYIVFSGDDIWNVARRYRSCCDRIIVITESESAVKKLFVPVIK